MITLQEYLNQKYPTRKEKEEVKEISIREINKETEERVEGINLKNRL